MSNYDREMATIKRSADRDTAITVVVVLAALAFFVTRSVGLI